MICPHCGKEFSDDLRSEFCPWCGGRFDEGGAPPPEKTEEGPPSYEEEEEEIPLFTPEPSEPEWEEEYHCPWEERDRLGFMRGWWETTKAVLFKPSNFYRRLQPMGRLGDAFLFAATWIVIASVFSAIYGAAFQGAQYAFLGALRAGPGGGTGPEQLFGMGGSMAAQAVINLFCAPVLAFVSIIISSGIYHLILRLLGGASQPYEASLRTLCYAQSSALWGLIPICGGYIALIYSLVIIIVGLNEVHRCGGGKAAAAVLLPIALCLLCVCGFFAFVLAAGIPALSGTR